MNSERKAFEEYYIANHHDGDIHLNQHLLEWSEKGEFYFATSVNDLWDMWYASANRKGYKIVPVEPTQAMLDAQDYIRDESAIEIYKAMIGAVDDERCCDLMCPQCFKG